MAMMASPKTLAARTSRVARLHHARRARASVNGAALALLALAEPAHGVLHDDDRAVDQQPEVDGAQAHQVSREPEGVHHRHREQQREGNGEGHHQPRAQVAQQHQQHQHHQQRALEQVLAHGGDGAVHHRAAIVEGLDARARRQRRLERLQLRLHRLGDGARVLPQQHQRHADHHLAFAILGGRTTPQPRAEAHLADRGDGDGHALRAWRR